jgi:hypothetical protein
MLGETVRDESMMPKKSVFFRLLGWCSSILGGGVGLLSATIGERRAPRDRLESAACQGFEAGIRQRSTRGGIHLHSPRSTCTPASPGQSGTGQGRGF